MYRRLIISSLLFCLLFADLKAQEVGLPFLKMGVGARQVGMGGAFAGTADDIYALYWNPGGLGHIRRWQWSASYNRWFTDVYQTSFSYVKQFRGLGSQKTAIGLSCLYLGMPSWDATNGLEDPVTANHLVGTLAMGQRLDWLYSGLSIGFNIKYIQSNLAEYSARGFAADAGFLLKPNRFRLGKWGLGIFDYGVWSLGASLSHFGTGMTFDTHVTSMPQTWRAGTAFKFGRYNSLSMMVAFDVTGVQDRDIVSALGTEFWWRNIIGARLGYMFNDEDLGGFSFGFGFRWDDVINNLLGLPSWYGDAFELNFSDAGYNDALQETYRGSVSHYSVAPEPFQLDEPVVVHSYDIQESSVVRLLWEEAIDPDPFDEIGYFIIFDKDKSLVKRALRKIGRDMDSFLTSSLRDSLLRCQFVNGTSYVDSVSEGGVYHWAVAAYDLARHVRLAKRGREEISQFIIQVPDPQVELIAFSPTEWITTTPEQGLLSIKVANRGSGPANNVPFVVEDIFPPGAKAGDVILQSQIGHLNVGDDTTFVFQWRTEKKGLHKIKVLMDPQDLILELNERNNVYSESFLSVPKGRVFATDTVEVMATGFDSTEIPVVPEIYFKPFSDVVDSMYYSEDGALPSVLRTFAKRLQRNPEIQMRIMGYIDALSGEQDPTLADERASRVRDKLIELGVRGSRLEVVEDHPDKILGRRRMPADSMDAVWIMEQNRKVTFQVEQEFEEAVFKPYRVGVDTTLKEDSCLVNVQVESPGGFSNWSLKIEPRNIQIAGGVRWDGTRMWQGFLWDCMDSNHVVVPLDHWYQYIYTITDTLNRDFKATIGSIYIQQKRIIRRQEIFGAAKFAQVEPVYQFYWDRMMELTQEMSEDPDLKLRFEGHACAIGSEAVNQRLSVRRAQRFTDAFLERCRVAYPDQYREIRRRTQPPLGFGERQPLRMKIKGHGLVLLGDNMSPVGRYLNRRIMVLLYREQ